MSDYDRPDRYEPTISDEAAVMERHPHGDYVEHSAYDSLLDAYNEAVGKLEKIAGIAT